MICLRQDLAITMSKQLITLYIIINVMQLTQLKPIRTKSNKIYSERNEDENSR